MAELRGSKQHSRPVAEGDSPALDGAETGGFDKVIELQATSSGRAAAAVAHRHAHASPHAHGPQHLTKRWQERSARGWAELRGLPWRLWTPRARGLVLLNLVMLACASVFVVLKEGQENVDPYIFSSLRFVIAALAFSPLLRRAVQDPQIVRGGIEIGIWAAGAYITQSVGMVTGEASRGAFLTGLTVVVVPVCAGLSGSGVKRATWGAVAVAVVGVWLLEGSGSPPTWGDLWNLASAVLFSLQIFRTEYYTKTYSSKAGLSMMSVALVVIALISLLTMTVAHPRQTAYFLRHPGALRRLLAHARLPWLEILYLGIGVTDGGLFAEVVALENVNSVEAAFIYTLEPVAGAALAYFWLGERWGPSGWLGALLIVGSCLMTQLYGAYEEHHSYKAAAVAQAEDPEEE